jgi:AraC-like DNA-binding protein
MQPMSCSGRFVRPFLKAIAGHPELDAEVERLKARPSERRVELERAYETVAHWVSVTRDPDLGLRAGETTCVGVGGPLDFAIHSAPTLRDGLSAAQNYARLYMDGLSITTTTEGDRAIVKFENDVSWPRAISDFFLSMWYRNHLQPHLGTAAVECSFRYAPPVGFARHQSVFDGMQLNFGAGFDGFSFDANELARTLSSADPLLHAVHCEHLDMLQMTNPEPLSTSMRVQRLIAAELQRGRPTSSSVARKLRMSRRTLVRRLYAEGTTFSLQLDELRRQLGLRLVLMRTVSLTEITGLLGFSHVQAFHRAFKRWTGQTPLRYRETAANSDETAAAAG